MTKPNRKSIRLKGYDYSSPGAYFITICTDNHKYLFGDIVDGEMNLNKTGQIVHSEWFKTETIRLNISLDAFVIMPNHVHGIIIIKNDMSVLHPDTMNQGTMHCAPATIEKFGKPTSNTIPTIIRGFKSAVTNRLNRKNNTPGLKLWQRNYWEHIIRNDKSMNKLRDYIATNPKNGNLIAFILIINRKFLGVTNA